MGILDRFRRNKEAADYTAYYAGETEGAAPRNNRAWLVATAAFAATLVMCFALFFGGRWVYRSLTKDNKPTATNNTDNNNSSSTDKSLDDTEMDGDKTPTPSPTPTPTPTPTPSTAQGSNGTGGTSLPRTGADD